MKRGVSIFLIAFIWIKLFSTISYDYHSHMIKITGAPSFSLVKKEVRGAKYMKIRTSENYGYSTLPGEPEIPSYTQLVKLPASGNFILDKINYEYDIIKLDKPLIPMGWEENIVPDTKVYSEDIWLPKEIVKIAEPSIMRNYRFTGITIFPFKYNPLKNELKILKNINIVLKLDLSKDENVLRNVNPNLESEAFYQIAKANILGMEDKRETYVRKNYLFIIDTEYHLNQILPLIQLKRKLGFKVYTALLDNIGYNKEDIKNFIQYAYDNWEFPPENVILFGDTSGSYAIPSYHIVGTYTPTDVTDLPYTLLSGNDYFPDIMLGRISVRGSNQLGVIIGKILKYQTDPPMDDDWFKRAVFGADMGYSSNPYMNLISSKETKEIAKQMLLSYGYDTVNTFYCPEDTNLQLFKNYLNEGCSLVNYRGFGSPNSWTAVVFGDMLTSNDIMFLTNGFKLPFITSIVCGGGDFDNTDYPVCFGETWLIAGTSVNPKGAIGFIGPSEHDTKTWFNNANDLGIYQGFTRENLQTGGQMLLRGKMELYRNFPYGHYMGDSHVSDQFYFYVYNLLGDPALPVWSDIPKTLNSLNFTFAENGDMIFQIDCNSPVKSNFLISITNDDSLFFVGVTNEEGISSIPNILQNGNYTATAYKKGYLPYSINFQILDNPFQIVNTNPQDLIFTQNSDFQIDIQIKNVSGENLNEVTIEAQAEDDRLNITSTAQTISEFPENSIITYQISGHINSFWQGTINDIINLILSYQNINKILSFPIFIRSPLISVQIPQDSFLNQIENNNLSINLINIGTAQTNDFYAKLVSLTDNITINSPILNVNNISPDNIIGINFTISAGNFFYGAVADFKLQMLYSNQILQTNYLSIPIYEDITNSPTLSYGYAALESSDDNSLQNPEYNWIELSNGLGELIPKDNFNANGYYTYISLPFNVNYFGREYNELTFSSAGWIAFGEAHGSYFRNRVIPSGTGPAAMIAVFWDEFVNCDGYKYYDEQNNRFILEWDNAGYDSSGGDYSFQVILYPSVNGKFSDIIMQYKNIENNDIQNNYSTTGIESPDQSEGLLIDFAELTDYTTHIPTNNHAILFTSVENLPVPLISTEVNQLEFTLQNNENQNFSVTLINSNDNTVRGLCKISYENGSNWLSCEQDTFAVENTKQIDFFINPYSLEVGDYKAYIEILSEYKQLIAIPVSIHIVSSGISQSEIAGYNKILSVYPNPFNPSTTIKFILSKKAKYVEIVIYNLKGQIVKKIEIEKPVIGENKVVWNGKDNADKKVVSGLYMFSLMQNKKVLATQKMIMIK